MAVPATMRTDDRAPASIKAAGRDERLYFQRLANRVLALGLVVMVSCLWLLRDVLAPLATPRTLTLLALAAIGFGTIVAFVVVRVIVNRAVVQPALRLIDVAEAVAQGDLTVTIPQTARKGSMPRLAREVARVVAAMRELTSGVREAARDAGAAAEAIRTGGEHMAATAQQIASTSNDLSARAREMAGTIEALGTDAGRLVGIAGELTAGAHAGVARNALLRQLAQESGARLVASSGSLETLAADAHQSATAVEALAEASEEIRAFVTLVTKMARQSKLLALNAAMEAARAGEQGQGFAVVANEVRRLAQSSGEAAERTEELVNGILARVAESRAASARAAGTVDDVRGAVQQGLDSFRQVDVAVREAEEWIGSIERAATRSGALIEEMNGRLAILGQGTARFATAMQDVAVASEEQSASTQEMAATGNELAGAATRLTRLVAGLRTE